MMQSKNKSGVDSRNTFKQTETYNRAYTIGELQRILKVSRTSVYRLVKNQQFHSVRIGGHYRISKKSFDDWFDGQKGGSSNGIC